MSILEFSGPLLSHSLKDTFSLIPPWRWGTVIWAAGSLFLFFRYFAIKSKSEGHNKPAFHTLLIPTWIYIGMFCSAYFLIDEVMVNLEHPYNLFHSGKFSMSPNTWIDGTVEAIYYLLHTPFAWDQKTLVLGNFLITLLTGWLHIVCLWRAWFFECRIKNILLLSSFALMFPLVSVTATGFGNSLLSLFFLCAVCLYLKGEGEKSLWVSGLLPMIRPDGILISFVHSFVFLIQKIWGRKSPRLREWVLAAVFPLSVLSLYFLCYKIFYGHFIPTPVKFKSFSFALLAGFDFRRFFQLVSWALRQPGCLVFISVLASLIFMRKKAFSDSVSTLFLYLFLLIPHFVFFMVSKVTTHLFGLGSDNRYWICTLLALVILGLKIVSEIDESNSASKSRAFVSFFLFAALTAVNLSEIPKLKAFHENKYFQRNYAAISGSFADKTLPEDFLFSTTEMNTFGFASDRFVVDLWGYSTPEIAKSHICSSDGVKNNPDFFLMKRPHIYWPFWFSHYPEDFNFDKAEEGLGFGNLTRSGNNCLGDMNRVIDLYDLFILKDGTFQTAYLMRKDGAERARQKLLEKGFQLVRQRDLKPSFIKAYNSDFLVQVQCA